MESWDRCRFTERRLLVDVAEQHELSVEAAEALDRYSAGRTLDGPVMFKARSMLTETAEELADAANYLRWEMVRAKHDGRGDYVTLLETVLSRVLAAFADLRNVMETERETV